MQLRYKISPIYAQSFIGIILDSLLLTTVAPRMDTVGSQKGLTYYSHSNGVFILQPNR